MEITNQMAQVFGLNFEQTIAWQIQNRIYQNKVDELRVEFYKWMVQQETWEAKAAKAANSLDFDYILNSKEFSEEEKCFVIYLQSKAAKIFKKYGAFKVPDRRIS